MSRLTLGFGKISDADLDTLVQNIISNMTNNPHFPAPYPKLEDVIKVGNHYSVSLVEAQSRDRTKVVIKNAAKKDVITILKALGNHIMSVAQGDETKLVSSGFYLVRKRGSAPPIKQPQKYVVKPGENPGEIITAVAPVKGARSYVHEYTTDPLTENSVWISVPSASRIHLFTGLPSGKKLLFRVGVVGINGQIVYTAIVAHIVL